MGGLFVQVLGEQFFIYKEEDQDLYAFYNITNQVVTNSYQSIFRGPEFIAILNNYLGTSVSSFTELPIEMAAPGPWAYPVEVVRP